MLTQKQLSSINQYFSTQPHIVAVYIYGSQARGTGNSLSDIDIAVMLDYQAEGKDQLHLQFIDKLVVHFGIYFCIFVYKFFEIIFLFPIFISKDNVKKILNK